MIASDLIRTAKIVIVDDEVLDADVLESRGMPSHLVIQKLRGRTGWYDPVLVEGLASLCEVELQQRPVLEIGLMELQPGMVLAEDVITTAGMLFVARGHEVSFRLVERLYNSASLFGREHRVHVIRGKSADVDDSEGSQTSSISA